MDLVPLLAQVANVDRREPVLCGQRRVHGGIELRRLAQEVIDRAGCLGAGETAAGRDKGK